MSSVMEPEFTRAVDRSQSRGFEKASVLFVRDSLIPTAAVGSAQLPAVVNLANAHLYAASPKLFFALRAFVMAMESAAPDVRERFGPELLAGWQALAEAAGLI